MHGTFYGYMMLWGWVAFVVMLIFMLYDVVGMGGICCDVDIYVI